MQTLACSSNVTKDVNLAVTEERSGSVDACSQRCPPGLSPVWHAKRMKSDYDTSTPLHWALYRVQQKTTRGSFSIVEIIFNEAFNKHVFTFICLSVAGGGKYYWKGMLFSLNHTWMNLEKKITMNYVLNSNQSFWIFIKLYFFYRKGKQ